MSIAFRKILVCLIAVFAVGAVASASASAFNLEWEVQKCEKVAPGTGQFTNGTCEILGAPNEFSETGALEKLAAGKKRSVTSSGGAFELKAGGKSVHCTAVTDEGTITGGKPGTDKATTITFTGCKNGPLTCTAESGTTKGTITVTNIPTVLVEREPAGGGAKKLADEFKSKENANKEKEFVTLKFDKEGAACPEYPETKVKGQVAAETVTGTGELNFPNPELKGNTLEAFGAAATLVGKDTQKGVGGGKVQAS